MTNANSFHSAVFVLILFAVIYFVALGLYEIKKWITKRRDKKREERNLRDDGKDI